MAAITISPEQAIVDYGCGFAARRGPNKGCFQKGSNLLTINGQWDGDFTLLRFSEVSVEANSPSTRRIRELGIIGKPPQLISGEGGGRRGGDRYSLQSSGLEAGSDHMVTVTLTHHYDSRAENKLSHSIANH